MLGQSAEQERKKKLHLRRRPQRSRGRPSYYAIRATEGEIVVPTFEPIGFLAQSRLIQAAQSGDTDALKRIWAQNTRLAFTVLNRARLRRHHVADGFQEAQIGLSRALHRFDIDRLNEFSTYAFWWMKQAVTRFKAQLIGFVRCPAHLYYPYIEYLHDFESCRCPSDWFDLRTRWLDRDPKLYRFLSRLHRVALPDVLVPRRIEIEAPSRLSPLARLFLHESRCALRIALDQLDERDRFVIIRRFGLDGAPPETLLQVGQQVGLTRERIRQIELSACGQLRDLLAKRGYTHPDPCQD